MVVLDLWVGLQEELILIEAKMEVTAGHALI
jgi:hypothetical protein